jgi:hypothetical protein
VLSLIGYIQGLGIIIHVQDLTTKKAKKSEIDALL